ncbi:Hypothetical predicted protein [Pelobates cultripes]|uniref:Uncharacterized protein n=1 Tax=Pelobates cultripes TaxID=61616 RepID=A0AAD1T427_PELCU|nr:Hypothetical predicted protein [Pelobates cultripes]
MNLESRTAPAPHQAQEDRVSPPDRTFTHALILPTTSRQAEHRQREPCRRQQQSNKTPQKEKEWDSQSFRAHGSLKLSVAQTWGLRTILSCSHCATTCSAYLVPIECLPSLGIG